MIALGKNLNQDFIVSSGRLWKAFKTTFWIATAMSLLVGQLH
jgi:hypothetical protein